MIDRLVQYAQQKGLATTPGLAPKTVRWIIWLGDHGQLLEVIELGDPSRKKNPGKQFQQ